MQLSAEEKARNERLRKTIAKNLKRFRDEAGMTQAEVAKALGLKDSSKYRNWETRSAPPIYYLEDLARIFNITIEMLFAENPEDTNHDILSASSDYNSDIYSDRYLSELQPHEKITLMGMRRLTTKDREHVEEYIAEVLRNTHTA